MSLASLSGSEIQLLNTSAAFAMSLGAKELFHTNFLAFLLESDDPALVPIQLAIRKALGFTPIPGAVPKCAVWREKNNLDLVVVELRPAPSSSAAQGVPTADEEEDTVDQTRGESGDWDWNQNDQWTQSAGNGTSVPSSAIAARASLYIPTKRVLVVEAKLKSITHLDQLIEYDNQLAGRGIWLEFPEDAAVPDWSLCVGVNSTISIERRLLSVTGVSMITPATATRPPGQWVGVSWKTLQSAMSGCIGALSGSPMGPTLSDYTDVLGALVALIDRVHQLCDDAHSKPGRIPTYGAMRLQLLAPQFKSLRINDLLGKTLFDHWLNAYVLNTAAVSVPMGWALNGYVHYSNGVPGLGLELVNDKFLTPSAGPVGLRIGVQIQNCEFRLFVNVNAVWSGLESWIATHPWLLSKWFSAQVFGSTPVGYRGGAVMPSNRPGRATNLKVFNVNRFLYSKYDIDNQSIVDVEREISNVVALASYLAPQL